MNQTKQQTVEEKFREEFPDAEEWQSKHQDEPCGIINGDEVVLLVYEDKEKFGQVPLSRLSENPDSFNYSEPTHKGDTVKMWTLKKENTYADYYYKDEYISKVAEILDVTPTGLEDYVTTEFAQYRVAYPCLFEKDGIRILVSPFILPQQ